MIRQGRNKLSYVNEICIVLFLIVLLTVNMIYQCSKKEGFHVDEMYAYTQICNTEYFRVTSDQEGERYLNSWHDVSRFEDFLTISDEEAFDLRGAWNTAYDNDAHPPLYFVILELVTSLFFRNRFTKWSGLCTNIPFFIFSLVVLYLWSKRLFRGRAFPPLTVMSIYGISVAAIDTVLFMRMYMMVTFFSLVLWYANTFLCEFVLSVDSNVSNANRRKRIMGIQVIILMTILLGVLTHYYFLIFSFFTCGIIIIWLLKKKKRRIVETYALSSCLAVGLCVVICPDFLYDLFAGGRGKQAFKQALIPTGWLDRCKQFVELICELLMGKTMTMLFLLLFIIIIAASLIIRKKTPPISSDESEDNVSIEDGVVLSLGIVTVLYVLIIALVAPLQTYRYVMNIIPGIILIIVYCLDRVSRCFSHADTIRVFTFGTVFVLILSAYFTTGILYRYPGYNEHVLTLEKERPYQAIIVTDTEYDGTFLAPYLLTSQAVYQTETKDLDMLKDNKGEAELNTLLFIGRNSEIPVEAILEQIKVLMGSEEAKELFCTKGKARQGINVYLLK